MVACEAPPQPRDTAARDRAERRLFSLFSINAGRRRNGETRRGKKSLSSTRHVESSRHRTRHTTRAPHETLAVPVLVPGTKVRVSVVKNRIGPLHINEKQRKSVLFFLFFSPVTVCRTRKGEKRRLSS